MCIITASTARSMPGISTGLLPGRIYGLRNEKSGVSSRLRTELLYPPRVDFCHVQIIFLIHAHPMHAPEPAGEITHAAPGVEQMPLQVPLDHFVGSAVISPNGFAGPDIKQVKAGWIGADLPFVKILAVFVKYLNAAVVPVVYENMMSGRIDGHSVHIAEIAGTSVDGTARRPA